MKLIIKLCQRTDLVKTSKISTYIDKKFNQQIREHAITVAESTLTHPML